VTAARAVMNNDFRGLENCANCGGPAASRYGACAYCGSEARRIYAPGAAITPAKAAVIHREWHARCSGPR